MENTAKTDNFLRAIKKYADKQHSSMRSEIAQLKSEKLEQAEKKSKAACDKYIGDSLKRVHNEETGKVAKLVREGQRKLFLERAKMTDSVFEKAEEKLIDFTDTKEYYENLIENTKAIALLFGSDNCTLYVSLKDMKYADEITSYFSGKTEITDDKSIKIGGIKGYCPNMGIIADETLDSKLKEQMTWFVENSGLAVI